MIGHRGTDLIDSYWLIDKWPNMADLRPQRDRKRHVLGDECWCHPNIVKPTCGGCGGQHFAIVCHNAIEHIPTGGRDVCRDNLISLAMATN